MSFKDSYEKYPDFQLRAARLWEAYQEAAKELNITAVAHPEFIRILKRVWIFSDFVAQACIRHPDVLRDLLHSGDLYRNYRSGEYQHKLVAALKMVQDEKSLAQALRQVRRREMLRIAFRDLAKWASLDETMTALSELADACVVAALAKLHVWQSEEIGRLDTENGAAPQQLLVLAMGKWGAGELNFSSDIDLIFAYPAEGEIPGRRSMSNTEFFSRLAGRLINVLSQPTADGFVFRVDARLRPFGDSGPLAMSFDAMEEYYQGHGRDWERYALVKARVISAIEDSQYGEQLMRLLRPFVYRRYLDFGAFESLRQMKQLILQEVDRRGLHNNIKLGPGGIREIEFIGQTFQLIRGGREAEFQERRILVILEKLGAAGYLPQAVTEKLIAAYRFLRETENRLQAWNDQQTHSLPQDEPGRLRLALAMGFSDYSAFESQLNQFRDFVQGQFEQVFAAPQASRPQTDSDFSVLWLGQLDIQQKTVLAQKHGFDEQAAAMLVKLKESASYRSLSPQGKDRLDKLMPMALEAIVRTPQPSVTLQRLTRLIESIARRTAYLALLVEYPMALSQLVKLCAASPWIAQQLALHPILLDELLDPRGLYAPLRRSELQAELTRAMLNIPKDDLEQQMEQLRLFKQSNVLRVAAADVAQVMPLMVVSDHLTDIAEVILAAVLEIAWQYLVSKHGLPLQENGAAAEFAIIGYGKLGGIELGYGSDLDLVFIHDSDNGELQTAGPKVIANSMFFTRLGQRIIHILNTHTPANVLYEVDMRLRPSGASGLLVTTMESFRHYQLQEAWTWEHQALVRARTVAGSLSLAQRFEKIRSEVLSQKRDSQVLQQEVRDMRQKMRQALCSRTPGYFDLKQGEGGIADIEFMVQYALLLWSHDYPELLKWSDNIRQLESLAQAHLFSPEEARFLSDAYRAYRARVHQLTLQEQPARVPVVELHEFRDGVTKLWRRFMEN